MRRVAEDSTAAFPDRRDQAITPGTGPAKAIHVGGSDQGGGNGAGSCDLKGDGLLTLLRATVGPLPGTVPIALVAHLSLDLVAIDRDRRRHHDARPAFGSRATDVSGTFGDNVPLLLVLARQSHNRSKVNDEIKRTHLIVQPV